LVDAISVKSTKDVPEATCEDASLRGVPSCAHPTPKSRAQHNSFTDHSLRPGDDLTPARFVLRSVEVAAQDSVASGRLRESTRDALQDFDFDPSIR
jgi:hypothetical protein